jgi:hypothetical protein
MKILSAVAAILFFAVAATAQTTNGLSDAEMEGRALAQEIVAQRLATNFLFMTGFIKIQKPNEPSVEVPLQVKSTVTESYRDITYWTMTNNKYADALTISHNNANELFLWKACQFKSISQTCKVPVVYCIVTNNQTMTSFANSDFWICDLGLEFFHWPEQKIIKKEFARGRGCMVLESTNPNPSPNGYSRVDCWIDEETLGIVQAKAYDANGKLLKEFEPKSFKKVNGQWELQDMEIRNVQTGSRTQIKFDLPK